MESLFFLPLVGMVILANYAERNREAKAIVTVLMLLSSVLLISLGLAVLLEGSLSELMGAGVQTGFGLAYVMTGAVPLIVLLKGARSRLSRYININPDSVLHALALYASLGLITFSVTLMLTVEVTMLLESLELDMVSIVVSGALYALLGFAGVGLFVRRNLRQSLKRLGIAKPSVKEIVYAIGVSFLLLAVVAIISVISVALGLEELGESDQSMVRLLGGITPFIALVVSLGAGISEEILFRGALQPRLGIVFTAFIFAVAHVQYPSMVALSMVFAAGLVLGWERRVFNTTAAMITHFLFNFIQLFALSFV